MICPECGTALSENESLCPACSAAIKEEPAEPIHSDISQTPSEEGVPSAEKATQIPVSSQDSAAPQEAPATPQAGAPEPSRESTEPSSEEAPSEGRSEISGEEASENDEMTPEEEARLVAEDIPEDEELDRLVADSQQSAEQIPVSSTYASPVFTAETPKKGRIGLFRCLVPVLAALILLVAVGGTLLLSHTAYQQGLSCLAVKDYAQALALFERFSLFDAHRRQAQLLTQQQAQYDEALSLMEKHAYLEAAELLGTLEDYRDSAFLRDQKLPYLHGSYLLAHAEAADAAALTQLPGYSASSEEEDVALLLYEGAAALLYAAGDYEDAPEKASGVYLLLTNLYLSQEHFEEALALQPYMLAEDAQTALAQYMTHCADEAVLSQLASAVTLRAEKEQEHFKDPSLADRIPVETELDVLSHFAGEALMFYDAELETLLGDYLAALEAEAATIAENGRCADRPAWYLGASARCAVIQRLIEKYDFLCENPGLQASFIGKDTYYAAAAVVEQALSDQLVGVRAQSEDPQGDYLFFENTTAYSFRLSLHCKFTEEDGKLALLHITEPVTVDAGASVSIPVYYPDRGAWENWYIGWEFTLLP